MHPYDRAIIEYEMQMWKDIMRKERSWWRNFWSWFGL